MGKPRVVVIVDDDRVKIMMARATARIVFPDSDIRLMLLLGEDTRGDEELTGEILLVDPDIVILDMTLNTEAFPSGRQIAIRLAKLSAGLERPYVVMHSSGWDGSIIERQLKRNGTVKYGASPESLRSELERLKADQFSDL